MCFYECNHTELWMHHNSLWVAPRSEFYWKSCPEFVCRVASFGVYCRVPESTFHIFTFQAFHWHANPERLQMNKYGGFLCLALRHFDRTFSCWQTITSHLFAHEHPPTSLSVLTMIRRWALTAGFSNGQTSRTHACVTCPHRANAVDLQSYHDDMFLMVQKRQMAHVVGRHWSLNLQFLRDLCLPNRMRNWVFRVDHVELRSHLH